MNERSQTVSNAQIRNIVARAKKYLKTAFPNPDREGCPNISILRAMAHRDKGLSLDQLPIAHIVTCSPCYQEYVHQRRIARFVQSVRVIAVSAVVFFLFFTVVRLVWVFRAQNIQRSISQKPHSGPPAGKSTKSASQIRLARTVDLGRLSPTRGDGETQEQSVQLPPNMLQVRFLLPLGMEPGEYDIRLEDSTGIALIATRQSGVLQSGVTSIEVDLDLTGRSKRRFTLMIRSPGLSWRKFPVAVE